MVARRSRSGRRLDLGRRIQLCFVPYPGVRGPNAFARCFVQCPRVCPHDSIPDPFDRTFPELPDAVSREARLLSNVRESRALGVVLQEHLALAPRQRVDRSGDHG
jgi:hypothetical protein